MSRLHSSRRAASALVALLLASTVVATRTTVGAAPSRLGSDAGAGAGAGATAAPAEGTVVTGALVWEGRTRTYRVFVPSTYEPGTPAPLVLGLHGGFGSGEQFQRDNGLNRALTQRGMLGVFPDGVHGPGRGIRTWNAGNCCGWSAASGVDDVGFLAALVAKVERRYDVDPARRYALGHSNGAMMSYRLACELPGTFAAIGVVEGAIDDTHPCRSRHRMNVLIIHGRQDTNVPWDGGVGTGSSRVDYASVPQALDRWQRIDHCDGTWTATTAGALRTKDADGCDPGGAVRLRALADGNHEWPGGADRAFVAGSPSDALDATADALDFFLAHPATP